MPPPGGRTVPCHDGPVPISALPGRPPMHPWIVVGTVWVTLAISSGLYFSFPIFFVALLEEFGSAG